MDSSASNSSSSIIPQKVRDHFTAEYCQNLIRRATEIAEIRVRCFELSRRDASCGYLGDYYRLAISCEIDGQQGDDTTPTYTFFVKTVPHDQPALLHMMHQLGIYGKENDLYHRTFPQIDHSSAKWRPHCYDASQPDYLVLEDLTVARPLSVAATVYQHLPHLRTFDEPHVRCVLHSLARMHASSLAQQLQSGCLGIRLAESFVRPDCEWFQTGLQAIPNICRQLPQFAGTFDADVRFRRHFHATLQRIFRPTPDGYCTVLCHRDLWFRNIMFEFATDNDGGGEPDFSRPVRSVLLDFQHSRLQSPAIDVAQLLHLGTRRQHRDAHLDGHLRCYWHLLCESMLCDYRKVSDKLPDLLTWPQFRDSYRELRPFALIFSCVYTPLMFLPARFLAAFRGNQRVQRAEFVVDVMRQDAGYRQVVLECCAELVELVEQQLRAEQ